MSTTEKIVYTAKTHTTGGRQGNSVSNDEQLKVTLTPPGSNKPGTNPEQLFAAGWSACYIGALGVAAKQQQISLPTDLFVDAEVDLVLTNDAYALQARLQVSLPGIATEDALKLVELAHQTCPYSKAVKGNIKVTTTLI